jgi:hypothetical protein
MPGRPIAIRAGLPRLEVRTVGQPDPAPLRTIAHPHRPQSDHACRDPQRPNVQGPTGMPGIGAQEVHERVQSLRSAALSQKGDVHDLTGTNLLGPTGNHNQTVCFGKRRQQMR